MMQTEQINALLEKIGTKNGVLLAQAIRSFATLSKLLLRFREYALALSDEVTNSLNRRVLVNYRFLQDGCYALVGYTVETQNCRMDFVCGNKEGNLTLRVAEGAEETPENNAVEIVASFADTVPVDFIESVLTALLVAHMNLYEQLTWATEGTGKFVIEPKTPN